MAIEALRTNLGLDVKRFIAPPSPNGNSSRVASLGTGLRRFAKRSKRGTQFGAENLGLLPRGEVAALFYLVVIDEIGIRPLGPTPGSLILLTGKHADSHRDLDALCIEKSALIFPI